MGEAMIFSHSDNGRGYAFTGEYMHICAAWQGLQKVPLCQHPKPTTVL